MPTVLSEVFYLSLITTVSALILKLASMCFKSKCSEVKLCGGRMSCIRDTEAETTLDLAQRTLGNKSSSEKDLEAL
jgi:hypothetical protein